ncbi:MAG: ThiF family adenylyltransferase [Candidatus Hodarchaeota archaeon]
MDSDEETRYSRQIVIPEIGKDGQEKLKEAKVVVIGTGGLGSPILMNLVAAGIGNVKFVDNDVVDVSNLNRQTLHSTSRIGMRKAESARKALSDLNPSVHLEPIDAMFTQENAKEVLEGAGYAIDASDNFETKFLLNDTAVELNIPCTIGGVIRWDGQLMSIQPGKTACYRCIFTDIPPPGTMKKPSELGIIGVTANVMGSIAATEAIKYFLGFSNEQRLLNRMLMMDLRTMDFTKVKISKNPRCKACSE